METALQTEILELLKSQMLAQVTMKEENNPEKERIRNKNKISKDNWSWLSKQNLHWKEKFVGYAWEKKMRELIP